MALSWTDIVPWINGDTITATRFNGQYGDNLNLVKKTLATQFDTAVTGTQNNFNFQDAGFLKLTNASAVTFTGFLAGYPGQILDIWRSAAGTATINHGSANSDAANQVWTSTAAAVTFAWSARLRYDGGSSKWRMLSSN